MRRSKWWLILLVAAGLGVLCVGAPVSADITYETKIAVIGAADDDLSDLLDDVSQLKKLEEQAATPIFRRSGRGLALTEAGETMLAYARRLLDLNDEAVAAVQSVELEGWVRLGLQEDFGENLLPEVLGRFARAHPKVRIEARVVRNAELLERVTTGKLDLALAWSTGTLTAHCEHIADVPMRWIGPANGLPASPTPGRSG